MVLRELTKLSYKCPEEFMDTLGSGNWHCFNFKNIHFYRYHKWEKGGPRSQQDGSDSTNPFSLQYVIEEKSFAVYPMMDPNSKLQSSKVTFSESQNWPLPTQY